MKRIIKISIPVLILAILLITKFMFFPAQKSGKEQVRNVGNKPQSQLSTVYVVKPKDLDNSTMVLGTVIPNEQAEIKSEIAGRIQKILFLEGQQVKKDQLLIKLADSEILAQLNKLQIQQKYAKDKLDRQQDLYKSNSISKESFEVFLNQLDLINADLEILKIQLEKTNIKAPFDGIAGFKNISTGTLVGINTILANITQISPVKIEFSLPSRYIGSISTKSTAEIIIENSSKKIKADISAINPLVDQATRTLTVRALYGNKGNELQPGSLVKVKVNLEKVKNALMIPQQSVIPAIDGQKLFLLKKGKAKETKVILGLRTESEVQVIDGINAGDSVLTSINQLKNGVPVKVKKGKK